VWTKLGFQWNRMYKKLLNINYRAKVYNNWTKTINKEAQDNQTEKSANLKTGHWELSNLKSEAVKID
jgi:hypothetical protein